MLKSKAYATRRLIDLALNDSKSFKYFAFYMLSFRVSGKTSIFESYDEIDMRKSGRNYLAIQSFLPLYVYKINILEISSEVFY